MISQRVRQLTRCHRLENKVERTTYFGRDGNGAHHCTTYCHDASLFPIGGSWPTALPSLSSSSSSSSLHIVSRRRRRGSPLPSPLAVVDNVPAVLGPARSCSSSSSSSSSHVTTIESSSIDPPPPAFPAPSSSTSQALPFDANSSTLNDAALSRSIPPHNTRTNHRNGQDTDETAETTLALNSQHNQKAAPRQQQQRTTTHNSVAASAASANMEEATDLILHRTKLGSMDEHEWKQAKGLLNAWTTSHHTLKSARRAEELLERLVREAQVQVAVSNRHCHDDHGAHTFQVITATMYNQCMNAWAKSGEADAAFHVEALLDLMQARFEEDPNNRASSPEPDTISYNTLLHALAIQSGRNNEDANGHQATVRAEQVIELMEEQCKANHPEGGSAVKPTTQSYNLVMLAYANRVGEYGSARAAEDWLLKLSELNVDNNHCNGDNGGDGPRPDTVSFNLVLKAWANSLEEKGPDRALEILTLFCKLSKEGHNVHPDATSFATVISSFAKRGNPVKAQEVLFMAKEQADHLAKGTNLTPCFNAAIDAWAKSGATDAGHMAETLLHTMVQAYEGGETDDTPSSVVVKPNVITYTSCLDAHTKSDHPRALEDADGFLGKMIDANRSGDLSFGPTTKTFNVLIQAWATSNRKNSAERSEKWLRIMQDLATNESFKCRPSVETLNFCIDAWAHSSSPDATARAARLLHQMVQAYEDGNRFVRPTGFSYRVVIKLLLSSGVKKDALDALYFVKKMADHARRGDSDAHPHTSLCNEVILALTKIGDEETTKGALNLLRSMDRAAAEQGLACMRPDRLTFTTAMNALSTFPSRQPSIAVVELYDRMEELEEVGTDDLRVRSTDLGLALTALSRIGEEWAADRTRSIFNQDSQVGGAKDEDNLVLNGRHLTTCLESMVNVGTFEYTVKGHGLLKEMILRYRDGLSTYLPLRGGFTMIVDALSKSGEKSSVPLVLEILALLADTPYEGHFRNGPGTPFYASAIELLIDHGNLQEAEHALLSWEDKARRHVDVERANVIIWNKLLRAWSRSRSKDKAVRARHLLDKLIECANEGTEGTAPDLTSYNTVLNAAAFVGSNPQVRNNAWAIMRTTFAEMTKPPLYLKPDDVTYGTMLKGINRLVTSESGRVKGMKRVFEESCASRQDGPTVMNEICKVLSDDEIQAIRSNFRANHEETSH